MSQSAWARLTRPTGDVGPGGRLAGLAVAIKMGISPEKFEGWPRWRRKLALLCAAREADVGLV